MKYRKKPVVIEAMQLRPDTWEAVMEWSGAFVRRMVGPIPEALFIEELEGTHRADYQDWIIRGVAGEFYVCKPDIFEQTYEPAD